MNWKQISQRVEVAQTLTPEALRSYLAELDSNDPETASSVRAFLQRTLLGQSFMQTSVDPAAALTARVLAAGTDIGVWKIEQLIGTGGMGEVYRAHRGDGLYDQTVALKVMQVGLETDRVRFERERQRLASLDHPGISRIIDGGQTPDDRPYMAMEYVHGTPIDQYSKGLNHREVLRLFGELCEAVSHAHGRLILHRDIKPSNVLVDNDGKMRLIDFGVASLLDGEEDLSGGALTLPYAAPEQLNGSAITVATDIFQLGMLLHHLLVGVPPSREPDGSVRISDSVKGEIKSIITCATEFDSANRFASADAFGDDVRAMLASKPVESHADGVAYRFGKTLRRAPLASALTGALIVALIAGTVISLSFANAANREAESARSALERSEFFLKRAELNSSMEQAYSDALQHLFGEGADIERMTTVLKDHAQNAQEVYEQDPDRASLLSYALGRHFLFRNDYRTSLEILEPWLENSYGSADLQMRGKQLSAIAYMNTGRLDEALPLLREVELQHAAGYDAKTPDHIAILSQIGSITEQIEDLKKAESALKAALEDEETAVQLRGFYWNSLSNTQRTMGKFKDAYDSSKSMVEVIEKNPLIDIASRDTARLHLATWELFYANNPDAARALVDTVLDTDQNAKGESRETGRAFELLGIISADNGDLQEAEEKIRAGRALIHRYAGEESRLASQLTASLVAVLIQSENFDEARRLLDEANQKLPDMESDDFRYLILSLAAAELNFAAGEERVVLISAEQVSKDHVLAYRYNRLVEKGVPGYLERN